MSQSNQPQDNTPVAMLWDFFGPNRAQTAEHHRIHLNEFAAIKQLTPLALEVLQQQERSVVSFVLPWSLVQELRPVLKPHRGKIWTKSSQE